MSKPQRTVQINFDLQTLRVSFDELRKVIGYLVLWGAHYPVCRIEPEFHSDTDFLAVYEKDDGTIGFVIGAVWSETDQTYSTHS